MLVNPGIFDQQQQGLLQVVSSDSFWNASSDSFSGLEYQEGDLFVVFASASASSVSITGTGWTEESPGTGTFQFLAKTWSRTLGAAEDPNSYSISGGSGVVAFGFVVRNWIVSPAAEDFREDLTEPGTLSLTSSLVAFGDRVLKIQCAINRTTFNNTTFSPADYTDLTAGDVSIGQRGAAGWAINGPNGFTVNALSSGDQLVTMGIAIT